MCFTKMKMQYSRLFCGRNKGFIFTLDATIATIIVISILIVSGIYISKSKEGALPKLQILNTGYDIMNLISQQNLWDDGAANTLIDTFLPSNYGFIAKRQCGSDTAWYNLAKDSGNTWDLPSEGDLVSGEYVFVKGGPTYCRARFYTWLK